MTAEPMPTRAMNLFYCYAHEDKELRDRLEKHLANLKRNGQISGWYDREIKPGQEWEHEIDIHLNNAHIILLLVSPDFMASDYCSSVEMTRALERQKEDVVRVIPVILRPVDWEDAPFSKLQALPTGARPVTKWQNRDEAFLDIVRGIGKVIEELQHIEQLLAKSKVLRESDREDLALDALDQAIRFAPTIARAHYEKGVVFLEREAFTDETALAFSAFEEAIQLAPNYAQAYFGRSQTFYRNLAYEEALVNLEQAIKLDPERAEYYAWKGSTLEKLNRNEEALATYGQAIQLAPNNITFLNSKLNLLIELNRYMEALITLENIIRLEPENASAYRTKGDLLTVLDRYDEALTAYEKAISLLTSSHSTRSRHVALRAGFSTLYINKGNILHKLSHYEEALVAYEQATQIDPYSSHAYRGKGKTYERLAQLAYEKANEIDTLRSQRGML